MVHIIYIAIGISGNSGKCSKLDAVPFYSLDFYEVFASSLDTAVYCHFAVH